MLLSCATSIDGYIDDAADGRLLLSNDADFDRVDEVRAGCDAILVGATTIRRDNPRLLVRSPARREARVRRGLPATPVKVTLTARGDLDPTARFFTTGDEIRGANAMGASAMGDSGRIVYAATHALDMARARVGTLAQVVDGGAPIDLGHILTDLAARGVQRLMVEGGGSVLTQFLAAGWADELHLVVAPFFVGDSRAPRFVADGHFPWHAGQRARLAETVAIDDVALLRYALSERFPGT